jgi:hypothetical protein
LDLEELFESERAADEEQSAALSAEGSAILEAELEQDEHPLVEEESGSSQHALLQRDLRRIALNRMEDAARTMDDYQEVIKVWDRLDANRERKERYHTISRGDVPLDYEAAPDGIIFPAPHDNMRFQAILNGDLEDVVFDCPFELHELVTDEEISQAIADLKDAHKEILFYSGLHLLSTAAIGRIRGQSDRNIRKVRATMLKRLHTPLLATLSERSENGLPLTTTQREFLEAHREESV